MGQALDPAGPHDAMATYAELAPQEDSRAGDPDFDYRFGLAAMDSGHVTRAIFALQRVVDNRPDQLPARAELARAYLLAGETENARSELALIPRASIPDAAAASLDRVLGVLDEVAPSDKARFSGYLELGLGRDSNVRSATNAGQFAIPAFGGLLFTVAPGGGREHDAFAMAAAGGNVQIPLRPQWRVLGALNGRSTTNAHAHDMNNTVVDGTLGVNHFAANHDETLAFQSSAAWVSSRVYRTANGLSAQWQGQLDGPAQLGAFAQWSRQEYAGLPERNTDRSVLGSSYARSSVSSDTLGYGSVYLADERARDHDFAHHGHHAFGLRIGGEQRLGKASVVFSEWQFERRRYGGTEPLFDVRRSDRQSDLLLGLRYSAAPQWQASAQIRYTSAASNVVLYDYARTVVQISLRKEFN